MNHLVIEKTANKISLTGVLDENSDLAPLAGLPEGATISFKGITRINSCGVRDWINFVKNLPIKTLVYEECPIVIIKQVNAVPEFSLKAKIHSFFAPYYCEACDQDADQLLLAATLNSEEPPVANCKQCNNPMLFDSIPKQYLSFLKRQQNG